MLAAALILAAPLGLDIINHRQIINTVKTAQARLAGQAKAPVELKGVPNRIVVPSLSIDLPVVSQSYSQALKTWPVAATTANYATETAQINNLKGQTLIYGHNNQVVFGPLLSIEPQAQAFVYTANGHIFEYEYSGSQDISPSQVGVIAIMAKAPAGLNLITCDGAFYQYRHVMNFKLTRAV